jgi:DNA-binding IclR family transcriptional regulator
VLSGPWSGTEKLKMNAKTAPTSARKRLPPAVERVKTSKPEKVERPVFEADGPTKGTPLPGTQTLVRGLEVIDAVAQGATTLAELAAAIELTRSTTHRLAATLVERRYLDFSRGDGYTLGPKLLELGFVTGRRMELPRVARAHLEALSVSSGDTVHLGVLDGSRALYLDKIQGSRRVEVSSKIGERQPLRSTGLGKALILDAGEARWREYYDHEARLGNGYDVPLDTWLNRMREYAGQGCAFDLEENEDRIRCVAAPIRGVDGAIVGAISVSSAAQYMSDMRMRGLTFEVKKAADAVSTGLGYNPATLHRVANAKKS